MTTPWETTVYIASNEIRSDFCPFLFKWMLRIFLITKRIRSGNDTNRLSDGQ